MSAENAKMYTTAPTQTASTAIKRENGIQKLSSLKPARDLTLGGRGGAAANAIKKEFKPNLNVVRNKNANVKTSKDTTARGRGGRGRGERGGRGGQRGGRGGANSTLIQTSGVFSEGAGALNLRKASSGGSSSYSRTADDAPSAMRKPTLIKNELKKIDLNAEENQVRELLGDSDDDRSDFMDDKTDLEQIPIKLHEAKWKHIKHEIKVEAAAIENGDVASVVDDEAALAVANKLQAMHVKQQEQRLHYSMSSLPRYPLSVEEFLQAPQPQLFVVQLPDVLPTCEDDDGGSDSPEKSTTESADKASTSAEAAAAAANTSLPASSIRSSKCLPLQKMEEGQVGKLLRYKSGKIKLILGETHFDLEVGMETGFLQDLMSITTIREERQGNMINLGPVQAKLTATPDWEHLLLQQSAATGNDNDHA